jgi:hypothetical protein
MALKPYPPMGIFLTSGLICFIIFREFLENHIMAKPNPEQELLNAVYNKDETATEELYWRFTKALKTYLNQKKCYDRDLSHELKMKSFLILYNKPEPPLLYNIKAHSYMLGIAKKLLLLTLTRTREKYESSVRLDLYHSMEDIIEVLEKEEEIKLLNILISKLSPKCQDLLEKVLLDEVNEEIREEMGYASMNMLYKKKSQCMDRLKTLGREDELFEEFYNY